MRRYIERKEEIHYDLVKEVHFINNEYLNVYEELLNQMFEFDQENPHHDLDLLNHSLCLYMKYRHNEKVFKKRSICNIANATAGVIAAIFHDIGKMHCWVPSPKGGKMFPNHEEESFNVFSFYSKMGMFSPIASPNGYIERTAGMLIRHHGDFMKYGVKEDKYHKKLTKDIFNKMIKDVGGKRKMNILLSFIRADIAAQNPEMLGNKLEVIDYATKLLEE